MPAFRVDGKAEPFEAIQAFGMAVIYPAGRQEAVREKAEAAFGNQARVLEFKRTRRRVPRVGEEGLLTLFRWWLIASKFWRVR